MWGHYHKLRSSDSVRSDWIKFVQESVGRTPSPVFYQHAIHEVFKCLIKCEYPVASDDETGCNKEITREEENVLRYVAGYICRKICDKLQATSLPHKEDLILCIHDMCGHDESDESEGEGTKDWINAVDRGGGCGTSTISRPSKTWFASTSQDLLYADSLMAVSNHSLLHWKATKIFSFSGAC